MCWKKRHGCELPRLLVANAIEVFVNKYVGKPERSDNDSGGSFGIKKGFQSDWKFYFGNSWIAVLGCVLRSNLCGFVERSANKKVTRVVVVQFPRRHG